MYRSVTKTTQKESSIIVLFTRKGTALGIKYFPVSKVLLFSDPSGYNYMQITHLNPGILLTITKSFKISTPLVTHARTMFFLIFERTFCFLES